MAPAEENSFNMNIEPLSLTTIRILRTPLLLATTFGLEAISSLTNSHHYRLARNLLDQGLSVLYTFNLSPSSEPRIPVLFMTQRWTIGLQFRFSHMPDFPVLSGWRAYERALPVRFVSAAGQGVTFSEALASPTSVRGRFSSNHRCHIACGNSASASGSGASQ